MSFSRQGHSHLKVSLAYFIVCLLSAAFFFGTGRAFRAAAASLPDSNSQQNPAGISTSRGANWASNSYPPKICDPNQDFLSSTEMTMLEAIKKKHKELALRTAKLNQERDLVVAAEYMLTKQLAALKLVEQHFAALQLQRNQRLTTDRLNLAKTYGVMQPQDAAQIFHHLNPDLVVDLLKKMDNRHSAAILAAMTPDDARSVTEGLADVSSTGSSRLMPGRSLQAPSGQ